MVLGQVQFSEGEFDVAVAEGVDELGNGFGRCLPDAVSDTFAVCDGDDAVSRQPLVVGRAREPDDRRAGPLGQLADDRADPASRTRHHHGVRCGQRGRPHARVGGCPDGVDGTCDFPREVPRAPDRVVGLHEDVLCLRAAGERERDNLVSNGPRVRVLADLFDDAGQVVPLPRGKDRGKGRVQAALRMNASPGLMPVALTLSKTCPGAGTGRSTSTTCSTSTPPYLLYMTARGMAHPFAGRAAEDQPSSLCLGPAAEVRSGTSLQTAAHSAGVTRQPNGRRCACGSLRSARG